MSHNLPFCKQEVGDFNREPGPSILKTKRFFGSRCTGIEREYQILIVIGIAIGFGIEPFHDEISRNLYFPGH